MSCGKGRMIVCCIGDTLPAIASAALPCPRAHLQRVVEAVQATVTAVLEQARQTVHGQSPVMTLLPSSPPRKRHCPCGCVEAEAGTVTAPCCCLPCRSAWSCACVLGRRGDHPWCGAWRWRWRWQRCWRCGERLLRRSRHCPHCPCDCAGDVALRPGWGFSW